MKKKVVFAAAASVLSAVFLYAGVQVLRQSSEYWEASASYSSLDAYVFVRSNASAPGKSDNAGTDASPLPTGVVPESEAASGQAHDSPAAAQEKEYDYPDVVWPEIDFAQLREINPDVVGWLYCEGVGLNYPVVQAKDDVQYLNMMFDGTVNKTGCPFLAAENAADLSDRHSIIFAHNRKDGSMFGRLTKYKSQEFYEEHPRILLITENARYVVELFSGHVARSDSGAWKIEFADDEEYASWQTVICERSGIVTNLVPSADDRVLTLSTCSYEFDNARYVLHGVLRRVKTPVQNE